jgi:hypothetical protein
MTVYSGQQTLITVFHSTHPGYLVSLQPANRHILLLRTVPLAIPSDSLMSSQLTSLPSPTVCCVSTPFETRMTLLGSFTKNNLIGLSFVASFLCTLSSSADLTLSHLKLHSTLPKALSLVKYQTFDIPWRFRRAHVFPLILLTGGSYSKIRGLTIFWDGV